VDENDLQSRFSLVPKPRLGNALAGEAPASRGPKPGLRAQMCSQAGAWEQGIKRFSLVPKPRLGNALAGETPASRGPKPGLGNEE